MGKTKRGGVGTGGGGKSRALALLDVRLLVEAALGTLNIPVDAERYIPRRDANGNFADTEYIVYFIEDEDDGLYADNKAHLRRCDVAIYYVTLHKNNKLTRSGEIIEAMEARGFRVAKRQIDLTDPARIDNLLATGWSGVRQEYILERFY